MIDTVIKPYEGVGLIKFGMTKTEVHQILGKAKSEDDYGVEIREYYNDGTIHIFYRRHEDVPLCRAMEFWEPAAPIFHGRNLLGGTSIEELRVWFELMDDSVEVNLDGLIAYGLGIALSTDSYNLFKDEPPDSVFVFTRGYHDEHADLDYQDSPYFKNLLEQAKQLKANRPNLT
jgi:hypothetical protein